MESTSRAQSYLGMTKDELDRDEDSRTVIETAFRDAGEDVALKAAIVDLLASWGYDRAELLRWAASV